MILTRSPLIHPQQAGSFSVRLACVKPAFILSQDQTLHTKTMKQFNQQTRPETAQSLAPPQQSHGGMTIMATIQKINGIKQTWHTIEFSNNHTNPTTPPHNVRPSSDSANKHDPRNIMNHTKHGADTTLNQIRKQSQIGMNGT